MKRSIQMSFFVLAVALTVCCRGGDTPATTRAAPLPGQFGPFGNLQGFTARGQWFYDWPQGKIPDTFAGFTIVETPVDNTVPNPGRTLNNWGRAIILKTNSGDATVRIWCEKQFVPTPVFPGPSDNWDSWSAAHDFSSIDFHGIPAALAETRILDLPTKDGKAPPGLDQPYRVFLIIRPIPADLIRIEARGIRDDSDAARRAAMNVAEAIYKYKSVQVPDKEMDNKGSQ